MGRLRVTQDLESPDTKRRLNERIFTCIAREYPWMTRVLSLGRDASWKRRLVALLPDLDSPVCVDLACGTGDLARLLSRRYPDGRILGLDLTEAMLAEARRRGKPCNVTYRRADMMDTGLDDGLADVVTAGYALRNAPDLDGAVVEIARLLRPSGYAAFLDFMRIAGGLRARAQVPLLRIWGSLWGVILHGDPAMYGYIAESLRRFPALPTLRRIFERHGLCLICAEPCFFGMTSVLIARKDAGP